MTLSTIPVVKETRMSKEMLDEMISISVAQLETEMTDSAIASAVKRKMTEQYPGTWHVFVGRNFGASVTHQQENAAYVYFGQKGVLCFRTP